MGQVCTAPTVHITYNSRRFRSEFTARERHNFFLLSYLVVLKQRSRFTELSDKAEGLIWLGRCPVRMSTYFPSQSLNANSGSDNINKHLTRYSFQISWLSLHFTLRWIISEANTDSLSGLCINHQEVVLKSISTSSFLAVSPFCYLAEKGHA